MDGVKLSVFSAKFEEFSQTFEASIELEADEDEFEGESR
jgi:hypothetical protein